MIQKLTPKLPGDKSLSHRLLFMSAMAEGESSFKNISESDDVKTTINVLSQLGVKIDIDIDQVKIEGRGFQGFKHTNQTLNCQNSGTTARHLLALLATYPFDSEVTGDNSLVKRPMKRIADPIHLMGGKIELENQEYLPALIQPSRQLKKLNYNLPIASAQIKSALLLAGANAQVEVELTGRIQSRDHTERLIPFFGGRIDCSQEKIVLPKQNNWKAIEWEVPNDFSAATFWIAHSVLSKKTEVQLKNVLLNPMRIGFLKALQNMGANIEVEIIQSIPENVGNLHVTPSQNLRSTIINDVVDMIDEVPLLVLMATQAEGVTRIHNANELRFKEVDRISSTTDVLAKYGFKIEEFDNGFKINGPQSPRGGVKIDSKGDHRMAMMALVANSLVEDKNEIIDLQCSKVSDPFFVSQFLEVLNG